MSRAVLALGLCSLGLYALETGMGSVLGGVLIGFGLLVALP